LKWMKNVDFPWNCCFEMWFELKLLLKMLSNLIWNDENVCENVGLYWTEIWWLKMKDVLDCQWKPNYALMI